MTTPDVRAFYTTLGIELPGWPKLEAPIRCFAQADAHHYNDRSPSCSVNLASGAWNCHGCGAHGGAYALYRALAVSSGALDPIRRPDLTNYGLVGFGRFSTPDAWLSTWSARSTNADFLRCAPGVTGPVLLVELTGDQASFPADTAAMSAAFSTRGPGRGDFTGARVAGTHFGGPIAQGQPTGSSLAAAEIGAWLAERYPVGAVTR